MTDKRPKWLVLEMIKKGALPFSIIIIIGLSYILYRINFKSTIEETINLYINKAFLTVFVVFLAFWAQRVCGAAVTWYSGIAEKTATKWDDEFIPLLRRLANIVVWIIALMIVLINFGININALIATLGVGSLAIALAAQDTIANVIAGFLIMVDKPFRIGDKLKLPSGEMVTSLDIGVRRSRFLAEDGSIIIVANLDLSKNKIINFTYGEERKG